VVTFGLPASSMPSPRAATRPGRCDPGARDPSVMRQALADTLKL
jgi:hypothetical protein